MGGCATKENKENKPADDADGCVYWDEICLVKIFYLYLITFEFTCIGYKRICNYN